MPRAPVATEHAASSSPDENQPASDNGLIACANVYINGCVGSGWVTRHGDLCHGCYEVRESRLWTEDPRLWLLTGTKASQDA